MADQNTGATHQAPIRFDASAPAGASGGVNPATPAEALACAKCSSPIGAYYYEAGGAVYCARCKRVIEESTASSGGFGRGALFGLGAAALGAIGYYAFIAITNIDWALVSIAVAAFVATAIRKGNGGRGSRRFQVLAVALTYLAIAGAYAPFMIAGASEGGQHVGIGAALFITLAGPIFSVLGGGFPGSLINVAIIGFALQRAWRMTGSAAAATGGHAFTGPYKVGARESAA